MLGAIVIWVTEQKVTRVTGTLSNNGIAHCHMTVQLIAFEPISPLISIQVGLVQLLSGPFLLNSWCIWRYQQGLRGTHLRGEQSLQLW